MSRAQWKVNGNVVKTEASMPESHFPLRFGASIRHKKNPSLTDIKWFYATAFGATDQSDGNFVGIGG